MVLHDVAIQFSCRTLTFGSQYCIANCNPVPTVAHAIGSEPLEPALCSLMSKVAPGEPAVSAGAGDIGAHLFTSPQVNNTAQADRTEPRLDARNGLGLDTHNGLGIKAVGLRLDPRNGLGLKAVGLRLDPHNGLGLDAGNGLGLDARNGLGLEASGPGPGTKPIQIAAL